MCGARCIWEHSVPSTQCCCAHKTALKKLSLFLKKKALPALAAPTGSHHVSLSFLSPACFSKNDRHLLPPLTASHPSHTQPSPLHTSDLPVPKTRGHRSSLLLTTPFPGLLSLSLLLLSHSSMSWLSAAECSPGHVTPSGPQTTLGPGKVHFVPRRVVPG